MLKCVVQHGGAFRMNLFDEFKTVLQKYCHTLPCLSSYCHIVSIRNKTTPILDTI